MSAAAASPPTSIAFGGSAALAAACCMATYVLLAERHVGKAQADHDATGFLLLRMVCML